MELVTLLLGLSVFAAGAWFARGVYRRGLAFWRRLDFFVGGWTRWPRMLEHARSLDLLVRGREIHVESPGLRLVFKRFLDHGAEGLQARATLSETTGTIRRSRAV